MLQCILKLLKAIFIVFPQCAKHSHLLRTMVPVSFYFEGAGAPIGSCFFRNVLCSGKNISSHAVSPKVMHELDWIMSF